MFITFDEGAEGGGGCCRYAQGGRLATLVISPLSKPAYVSSIAYDHYSLLRRAERAGAPRTHAMVAGDLRLDVPRRRAWLGSSEMRLTPKEFELLAYLMRNRGVVLSRDQLPREVWGDRVASTSQTLDVYARWLRQKVEPDPERPVYIQTVRMIGYRFEGPATG